MSPIIHAEVGWLVAQSLPRRRDRLWVVGAAVVADLDGAGLLVSEDLYYEWHHKLGHGLLAAVVIGVALVLSTRSPRVALLGLVAFHSHIVLDLVGSGPGWPIFYFWPWSSHDWLPSWQWDLASWQNSVFGLTVTLVALSAALWAGRTPFELVALRLDAAVVQTLRARFGRRLSE